MNYEHTWRAYRLEDQHILLEVGDSKFENRLLWRHIDDFTAHDGWELVNVMLLPVGGDTTSVAFFRRPTK